MIDLATSSYYLQTHARSGSNKGRGFGDSGCGNQAGLPTEFRGSLWRDGWADGWWMGGGWVVAGLWMDGGWMGGLVVLELGQGCIDSVEAGLGVGITHSIAASSMPPVSARFAPKRLIGNHIIIVGHQRQEAIRIISNHRQSETTHRQPEAIAGPHWAMI